MSPFELGAYLEARQGHVERLLSARVDALQPSVPGRLLEAMRYSLLGGGKRLRPLLCLAFAEATAQASGGGGAVAQDAACALEAIHTYSLVHDDLPAMDDDALRRGRPTNHKVFGEALAILAGDALLTHAWGWLSDGPEGVRLRLVSELAEAAGAAGMVGGQVLDIAEDRPASEAYLLQLHRRKTGALIRAACRMGVLAASGSLRALENATIYGEAVGLAFQIADDVLDVSGEEAKLGKPAGADAAAGRFTFPAVLGLEGSRQRMQVELRRALAAVEDLEPGGGPLTALARYAVERER